MRLASSLYMIIFSFQTMRVTELQSVIAELTRKLTEEKGGKILEEDEDEEDGQSHSTSDMEVQGVYSSVCPEELF